MTQKKRLEFFKKKKKKKAEKKKYSENTIQRYKDIYQIKEMQIFESIHGKFMIIRQKKAQGYNLNRISLDLRKKSNILLQLKLFGKNRQNSQKGFDNPKEFSNKHKTD